VKRVGERVRQGAGISRRHEEPGALVGEQIGDSSDPRGDHRPPARQGLEDDVGRSFRPAREREDVARTHPRRDVRLRLRPHGPDRCPPGRDAFSDLSQGNAVAHEREHGSRDARANPIERVDELAHPLTRLEAADEQNEARVSRNAEGASGSRSVAWMEDLRIDPVPHAVYAPARDTEAHQLFGERSRDRDHRIRHRENARGQPARSPTPKDDVDVRAVHLDDAWLAERPRREHRRAAVGVRPRAKDDVGGSEAVAIRPE
jgi:hypothetical protein